jgi:regulator of PEP synthase PpsR (kinase-PPPase family)
MIFLMTEHSHPPQDDIKIIIISDGTGETASLMTKAAVVQFSNREISFTRYKNIRTQVQIESIFEDAVPRHDLIVYTLVSPELRKSTQDLAAKCGIAASDVLGPLLNSMALYFEVQPKSEPGLTRVVDENYFRRIAAMEFTIHHDDGKTMGGLAEADIVILGISRTSKTPLSMYLSMQGYKVLNIPLVRGIPMPPELAQVDTNKIICLTIQAEVLHTIRKARLDRLGKDPRDHRNESYASMEHVVADIEYATELFRQNRKWPVFDVSGKALEETASEVIRIIGNRKKLAAKSQAT